MRWHRRQFGATLIAFALIAGAGPAASAGPALELIQQLARSAEPIVNDRSLSRSARSERLSAALRPLIDQEDMAKSLLGRYWRRATPAQQSALVPLLDVYLIDVYAGRVDSIEGQVTFAIDGERVLADRTLVDSRVVRPDQPDILVGWQVEEVEGRRFVTDIIVEGVSLIVSQRAEFASVIRQQGGLDGLIALLRDRAAE